MGSGDLDKKTVEDLTAAINKLSTNNDKTSDALLEMQKRMDKMEKGKSGGSSSSSSSSRDFGPSASSLAARSIDTKKALSTGLTDDIKILVKTYGGLIDYGTSDLENRASVAIKLQVEKLTEFALETSKFIGAKSIQQVFGNAADARKELMKIYDANTYFLNKIAEDYKDSEDAGTEAMANSLLIREAMRIKPEEFSKIVEVQMSGVKKFTTDVFEEIAFYAGEYANRTSASIFQITNQLSHAVGNFEVFGGASTENLGKLAGMMGELRMDVTDVSGLISKLQSFEGSVGVVRDLAGAFGAVIDPAKLMGDAINDPAEALNSIRQALLDAGHNTETLGFKVTLLAKDLGVSSDSMRRFLNQEIDAQAVLQNSVEKSEMTAEKTSKIVADAQKQIVDDRSFFDNAMDIFNTQQEILLQSSLKTIQQFGTDMNQWITANGSVLTKFLGKDSIAEASSALKTYMLTADEEERAKAKKTLKETLKAKNLSKAAREEADKFLAKLEDPNFAGKIQEELREVAKIQNNTGPIDIDINVNDKDVRSAVNRINKSPEVLKYKEVMNEPYKYVTKHSDSLFEIDMIANMKTLDRLLGRASSKGSNMDKFKGEIQNLGNIDVKLNDGSGEMSLSEFTDKVAEINKDISSLDQNNNLIQELQGMRQDLKNIKYVANITNDGTYTVVLGDDLKSQVREIASQVVEEVFDATGITTA